MKHKLFALLLAGALLALSGCSLAQPAETDESSPHGDRLIGAYATQENWNEEPDYTHWVEYGSDTIDTEFGALDLPNLILKAEYDEETQSYTFPGMDGYALFAVTRTLNDAPYTHGVNEMFNANIQVSATDTGSSYDLSGTVYHGSPLGQSEEQLGQDGRVWAVYSVYQMADGTVYLSSLSDSYIGPGTMTITLNETYTTTENGEETEIYTNVAVTLEYIEQLTTLTVHQYGADGQLLDTAELPITEELPAIQWHADAVWAAVEETRGGEQTRTVIDRPFGDEPSAYHSVIMLDNNGFGVGAMLNFE